MTPERAYERAARPPPDRPAAPRAGDARAGDVALACMSLLVDELAAGGMRHACVSPGSRSTPLALALARHPDIAIHVHVDERSSAYFALGIARATGAPVGVACTSGTAAANFHPAVVEASMSNVPLLLLTADRPPELRGTGANQTIDQRELYGRHARAFLEPDLPRESPAAAARWRRLGAAASAAVAGPHPGPVHLNLPFDEPLTPTGAAVDLGSDTTRDGVHDRDAEKHAAPFAGANIALRHGRRDGLHALATALAGDLASARRVVVVAGGMDRHSNEIVELAAALRAPLIAEPTSQLRRPGDALAAGYALMADERFARRHRPDVVLRFGTGPIGRSTAAFIATADRVAVIEDRPLRQLPSMSAAQMIVHAAPGRFASLLLGRLARRPDVEWLAGWREADAVARRTMDEALDAWDEPFEGRVARDVGAAAPAGGTLVVGSSMPIRDLDAFMAPRHGLRVLANRGASGIDGVLSTALGVAATDTQALALIGDLSLLHDAGALLWNGRRAHDLVVIVPNNDGGVVFSFLDQRELPEHEWLFTTPHGLDLGALARAAGVPHRRVDRASELIGSIEDATSAGGVHLIEVRVDRAMNVARHADVRRAVETALAAEDPGGARW